MKEQIQAPVPALVYRAAFTQAYPMEPLEVFWDTLFFIEVSNFVKALSWDEPGR